MHSGPAQTSHSPAGASQHTQQAAHTGQQDWLHIILRDLTTGGLEHDLVPEAYIAELTQSQGMLLVPSAVEPSAA